MAGRVIGVIPARLQSTRLPRKLLLNETGKPLLQYTWEAASAAKSLSEILVATDSIEISACVRRFGGQVELTANHPSGTDRVAEIARQFRPEADILVNIQGDEPEIDPNAIDLLVKTLQSSPSAQMATLATPITNKADLEDPGCVKVVCGADGRALYFSRLPIPYVRDGNTDELLKHDSPWKLHLGIYAYRRAFLMRMTEQPPSPLEQLEKLEQLRALEAGANISVATVLHRAAGIDTPTDYARFVSRQKVAA
ncbi:3-deoxy-manno-octulosonate cytidylyltransferase [Thalassoroseus pseudoceratinae]|uniref:3-deoxy-manno-octulosonate cytidylyltransferase n=1 Tax=Thalassoroseus pseudoceratinae TaxID=2713176 RepID=UPI0014246DEB|nr:3-deoxy-manno-octulosonate cytidylyltransferase [Thalassoroseus pseudoceratinae]